jgi:hypothetical protein
MLRNLASEYNVNRSILSKKKSKVTAPNRSRLGDDPSAELLCELLKGACRNWPDNMKERADACIQLAQKALRAGVSNVLLASASTKFMWFLKPEGWTVYDRFARKGLGSSDRRDAKFDMPAFYEALESRGFVEISSQINDVIRAAPFSSLPAERILDTLLMARGGRGGEDALPGHRAFLALLPAATRSQIVALSNDLQHEFGNGLLASSQQKKART